MQSQSAHILSYNTLKTTRTDSIVCDGNSAKGHIVLHSPVLHRP